MSEIKFRNSLTRIIGINVTLLSFPILIFLVSFGEMIVFWGTDREYVKSDSQNSMALVYLFAVIWTIFACWLSAKILSVKFTNEGVWQRSISNWEFIAWKNVTSIEELPYSITILQNEKKVNIFMFYFADADEVLRFIQERLTSNATY